uniref:Methyltransferase FkbM domain-containing protein n=1 Tax=Leptocylindrus danicus TaxID=163516 RepID=A0A7S2PCD2_9STRA
MHKQSYDPRRWKAIWNTGNYYERGINDIFHEVLMDRPEPGLVIDVGMNIGWFSLYSRAHGHHVAAFEPNVANHFRMCESIVANKWDADGTVSFYPYGVGSSHGETIMYTPGNPGGASLIKEHVPLNYQNTKRTIQVEKLDDIAEDQHWTLPNAMPIYLLKVDVEGYEPFVIEGGRKLIQSGKVEHIIMEKSNTDEEVVFPMYSLLYQSGYRIAKIMDASGNPRHSDPETLARLNSSFEKLPQMMETGVYDDNMKWMLRSNYNLFYSRV